ncbi:MAG: hypothetical protein WCF23_04830 [Candidatus Nitrosopolaris sp.]
MLSIWMTCCYTSIMGLSVLTTNWFFKPVMAVGIGNTGAFVIQEQVNTGNPVLDRPGY